MPVSHFVTAQDGLRLHVEVYGSRAGTAAPVVCLPGLTRTSADFQPLASALAGDHEQRRYVIAIDYRGSYILSFAGYNAGRGRVRDWVARYGDPRDPKVDPIDWVERIPFSETRNYVQRVLENLQVYRVRFGGGSKLLIEADLAGGRKP